MSPEISRDEARTRLEKSVANVDLIESFLGPKTEEFIEEYRVLSAQLRKGDS